MAVASSWRFSASIDKTGPIEADRLDANKAVMVEGKMTRQLRRESAVCIDNGNKIDDPMR